MIPQNTKIFVVTVHYGDPSATETLLNGLLKGSVAPEHIVVVDHADAPFRFPADQVTVVRPEKNEGYGAGIQTGLGVLISKRIDPASIIVCLNNDTVVAPNAMKELQEALTSLPKVGVIGNMMGRVNLLRGKAVLTNGTSRKNFFSIPYIDGALIVAPLNVLLGLKFPTHYFMYWEDILFSKRAQQKAIPLKLVSLPGFTHTQSSNDTLEKTYYLVRNGALFLENETPFLWKMYWQIVNRIRYPYHRFKKNGTVAKALLDARKHVTGQMV